jgi:nucleoside-diphosphate-sugar epimerase
MGKKLLVTGCCGHIGSSFRDYLYKYEDAVGLDNLSSNKVNSLFFRDKSTYDSFVNKGFEEVSVDFLKNFDTVVHLAALTNASASVNSPEEYEKINEQCTKDFIKKCIKAKVKKFVFPSSTSVYGVATDIVTEDKKFINPQSPYATTKIKVENFINNVAFNSETKFLILRLGTISGWSLGMRFHTAVNKLAFEARIHQKMTVWKDALNFKRPYLSLKDLTELFYKILGNDSIRLTSDEPYFREEPQTYNILTQNIVLQDIIKCISNYCKYDDSFENAIPEPKINLVDSPLLNQFNYEVSFDKAKKELGFIPEGNVFKDIRKTMERLPRAFDPSI